MSRAGRGARELFCMGGALMALCGLCACVRSNPDRVQGYIEGEYVYVASSLPGALESLYAQRGQRVKKGDGLFALDSTPEKAQVLEAERRVSEARATLNDLEKGMRPTEIQSLREQAEQARAALILSRKELARRERLFSTGAISKEVLDRARSICDRDLHRVSQLEEEIKTAKLGSRSDRILAAESNMLAREAALRKARWELAQKRAFAPKDALVFDTLYREGEWVAAGKPVVALLPAQNIKLRAFVPETRIGSIKIGERVLVFVDSIRKPFSGKVSFISPGAEYTPPVIYSREARSKLVFMVEAVFDPQTAEKLHPGQPVDVEFGF